jgi:MFS transporter, FHS family, L-fucose permease
MGVLFKMLKILKDLSPAFVTITALIFGLGFVASNNEPLLAALRLGLNLNWTHALFIQITGLVANGIIAIPAAILLEKIGSTKSIIGALLLMLCACIILQFQFVTHNFYAILFALFIMASGLSTIQVAANPLIAVLGHADYSHFRLTLAQTFNSLGVVIGVHFGTKVLLSPQILEIGNAAKNKLNDPSKILEAVSHGYFAIGILVLFLILMIFLNTKQIDNAGHALGQNGAPKILMALKEKWAILGAIAIGLYVGAEVSIASVMINFLGQSDVLALSTANAGYMLANFYWGGALLGRFLGSVVLTKIRAPILLLICGASAGLLCLIVVIFDGAIAGYAALLVGLFNSIMFPVIFTMTLRRTNAPEPTISGLLCLAISGGAVLALGVGRIADSISLNFAFIVPFLAYLYIFSFAILGIKTPPTRQTT